MREIEEHDRIFHPELNEGEKRLVVRAWNQGGHDCTEVDLADIIAWVKENRAPGKRCVMLMRVELDIYAGRPNPQWEMDNDQAQAFLAALEKLSDPVPAVYPAHPRLGYRGFLVWEIGYPSRPWSEAIIFYDTVILNRPGKAEAWSDPDWSVQTLLLSQAIRRLSPEVIERIQSDERKV